MRPADNSTATATPSRAPGIYVHVPFCARVCPYCDFSVSTAGPERYADFTRLLVREIELVAENWLEPLEAPVAADTVYFGGGTPSRLGARQIASIVEALTRHGLIAESSWISMEANPEDVSPESCRQWRDLGIRSLNLGVQALNDELLCWLGRAHRVSDVYESIAAARQAGIAHLSIDLIYGMAHRAARTWLEELEAAAELQTQHISCYQLTIHEDTAFGRRARAGEAMTVSQTREAELIRATHRVLGENGLAAYEVSNFARSAYDRSRHNQKYWHHVPYLGVGPSAHSFDGRRRFWNLRSFEDWGRELESDRTAVEGEETLSAASRLLELLMLQLRTSDGVDLDHVQAQFGVDLATTNAALLESLLHDGLAERKSTRLVPTVDGLAVADGMARSFRLGLE